MSVRKERANPLLYLTTSLSDALIAGTQSLSFANIPPAIDQLLKRSMVEGKGNASQSACTDVGVTVFILSKSARDICGAFSI